MTAINRRIYSLARPIWLAQLDLDYNLDKFLPELLDDSTRLQHLRRLELTPSPSHAYLVRHTLSRLPRLRYLKLTLDADAHLDTHRALNEGIRRTSTLTHLHVMIKDCPQTRRDLLHSLYFDEIFKDLPLLLVLRDSTGTIKLKDEYGMTARSLSLYASEIDFTKLDWQKYSTFRLKESVMSDLGHNFIDFLKERVVTVENGNVKRQRILLPLKRLSLDLEHDAIDFVQLGRNPQILFSDVIRLLSYIQLERLDLTGLYSFPTLLPIDCTIPSLKILTLHTRHERFSFRDSYNFLALSLLLGCFPSLEQLHLKGPSFFGYWKEARAFSEIDHAELCFQYPELASLLYYLEQTDVKILSVKGLCTPDVVKWIRSSKEEKFVRDCWRYW